MTVDKNKQQVLIKEIRICLSDPVIITTRKGKKHLDLNKKNDLPYEEEQIERAPVRVICYEPQCLTYEHLGRGGELLRWAPFQEPQRRYDGTTRERAEESERAAVRKRVVNERGNPSGSMRNWVLFCDCAGQQGPPCAAHQSLAPQKRAPPPFLGSLANTPWAGPSPEGLRLKIQIGAL
jgi:hypothetical protein